MSPSSTKLYELLSVRKQLTWLAQERMDIWFSPARAREYDRLLAVEQELVGLVG